MTYIILDRDGVINFESEHYIKSPDEWHAIPGSLKAIARLNSAGYKILIATNQSGVGRGYYSVETLGLIHQKLMQELAAVGGCVDEIFFCPHHPDDRCGCRKPAPGMLEQIQNKYQLDLTTTYYIGDSYVDVQVARTMNCLPLLVMTGNGEKTIAKHPDVITIPQFKDLDAAVDYVLAQGKNNV